MRGMTRAQFWGEVGNYTPIEPLLLSIYEDELDKEWRQGGKSPHGHPWHTSFHASSFPGDDDSVCGRAQVYELMNPAAEKPFQPWLKAWFDLGSNLEHDWVRRLSSYGVLLSADVTGEDEFQTGFKDEDVWLTGSPDLIVLPPFYKKCMVVEVKTTSHDKVLTMLADSTQTPYSHEKYIRQCKTYIGEAHKTFSPTVWICRKSGTLINESENKCSHDHDGPCVPVILKVEPPDDGALIYSSREEPLKTVSYYVQHDPGFMVDGKKKLAEWKDYFLRDEIPPHVREGEKSKWSVGQCQFCNHKKNICKPDYTKKITKLSESHLVSYTKSIRGEYSPELTRKTVLDRWS